MTDIKHSPLPWELCDKGDYSDFNGNSQVIYAYDDELPFRVAVVHVNNDEGAANAELIVKAVNNHAKLVEALEDIAGRNDVDGNSMMCDTHEECQRRAEAALSAVKEE